VKLLIEQKLGTGVAKKGNSSCMHSQEQKSALMPNLASKEVKIVRVDAW